MTPRARAVVVACGLLALAAGCGGPRTGTVRGRVTYAGAPVPLGTIAFLPTDGRGPACGGPIRDGAFTVSGIPPGPKLARVRAVPAEAAIHDSRQMLDATAAAAADAFASLPIARAAGNDVPVTVAPGTQVVDLPLLPPP